MEGGLSSLEKALPTRQESYNLKPKPWASSQTILLNVKYFCWVTLPAMRACNTLLPAVHQLLKCIID
eukprot:1161063-Pelagomonas_calceolata.AAC.5